MDGLQEKIDETGLNKIYEALDKQVPSKTKVKVKNETPRTDKVDENNRRIIEAYLKGEETHLQQQKPVSIIIAISVGLQLIAFNVLIFLITLTPMQITKLSMLLDFLKYYTGAVIVEMLGLSLVVVRGVFSVSIGKMVEHILKRRGK